MTEKEDTSITIIGAGPAGLILALLLEKHGFNINIYESRTSVEDCFKEEERSYSIDLSKRSLNILNEVNIASSLSSSSFKLFLRELHFDKDTVYEKYNHLSNEPIVSVNRKVLYKLLFNQIIKTNKIKIHFSHKLVRVSAESSSLEIVNKIEDTQITLSNNYIFICAGASIVSKQLKKYCPMTTFPYYQYNYKEILVPRNNFSDDSMQKWVGTNQCFIVHPFNDKHSSGTFIYSDSNHLDNLTQHSLKALFCNDFPGLSEYADIITEEFQNKKKGMLLTSFIDNQLLSDNICIIGDSAHTLLPFLGQGLNYTINEIYNVSNCLSLNNSKQALRKLFNNSKNEILALANMSNSSYRELYSGASKKQIFTFKNINNMLCETFKSQYVPFRTLLYFSSYSYTKISQIRELQFLLINEIINKNHFDTNGLTERATECFKQYYMNVEKIIVE